MYFLSQLGVNINMKSTVHNSFSEFIIIVHHEILRRFLYFCVADNTEIKPKKKNYLIDKIIF